MNIAPFSVSIENQWYARGLHTQHKHTSDMTVTISLVSIMLRTLNVFMNALFYRNLLLKHYTYLIFK